MAIALLFSLTASLYGMRWVQQQNTEQVLREDVRHVQDLFQSLVDGEIAKLDHLLEFYKSDPGLLQAFQNQDRAALLHLASPILAQISTSHNVSQFLFINQDQKVFLRVDNPEEHGDVFAPFNLIKAGRTNSPASGVEIGGYSRLTIRSVHPWLVHGQLIGFIALAQDITHITPILQKVFKGEVFITLSKSMVDKEKWLAGRDQKKNPGTWDELPACVVVDRSSPFLPKEACEYLNKVPSQSLFEIFTIEDQDKKFRGGVVALLDAGQQYIGNLFVLRDVTQQVVSIWSMAVYLGGVGLVITVLLFAFFSYYVGCMDRKLVDMQSSLLNQLVNRETELHHSSDLLRKDIAMREEVERDFQRVSLQNQLILDSVGEGIFGLDINGNHTFANPQAAKMLGYSIPDLIGKSSHALWHHTRKDGTEFPEEECPIRNTLTLGKTQRIEDDLFWRSDGTSFPVDYISTPIWEGGRVQGAVVSFKDISARKKVIRDLEVSENRYRVITATAQDAIVLMDDRGLVAYWNPAAERIFGYTALEALGRNLHEIVAPKRYAEDIRKGIAEFKESGSGATVGKILEVTGKRKNGEEFTVELSVSALRQEDKWWAVGVARDITERLQARQEREELQAQLRQSQKMEAIGTLAGGIAHDFNNILGAIMGYTELALIDAPVGEPIHDHLEEIRKASSRAKDLVAHILAFSRQTEMARKPLTITPIIKEALKMLRASLPTTIDIRQSIDAGVGRILADPTQIHQIMMNLCTNAAHAMRDKGGQLTIELHEVALPDGPLVQRFDIHPGRYVQLTVADSGVGIDAGILDKIFDPFFTTKVRGEGTGMGLSVVHGIITSHGGAIEVESAPGEGTRFDIYFPAIETDKDERETMVVDAPPTGKEKVLLVDDEPALIELGTRVLTYLGYDVVSKTSSLDALKLFEDNPQDFDLVITDFTMPNMTGGELSKKMLTVRPDLPIIMCTGFSEVFNEEKAKELGIRGYVMKPISIHDLAQTCRNVLDSR